MGKTAIKKETDTRKLSALLKALADETRITILELLQEGELCVCEIMDDLSLSQPAVSHHLKTLRQIGFIDDRREGKWVFYSLNPELLAEVEQLLQRLLIDPVRDGRRCREPRPHPRCHEK